MPADPPAGSASSAGSAPPLAPPAAPDWLSGTRGTITGRRASTRARVADLLADGLARGQRALTRLDHHAARAPATQRVLACSIVRPPFAATYERAVAELRRSRHALELRTTAVGGRGKFENLQALIGDSLPEHDWLLVLDDDVVLPHRFLDRFLHLAGAAGARLAQPAHDARSHAAWPVTRRVPGSLVRTTRFVEIGPVTAFHRDTFSTLLPFPPLRMGWGLDAHWAAVAREHGWPLAVVDATPVHHGLQPVAGTYDAQQAIAEGARFLADRPYLRAQDATTLRTWRRRP